MEGGIPLRDFVNGAGAPAPAPASGYLPIQVEQVGGEHGRDQTRVSESSWRGGIIVALVVLGLIAAVGTAFAIVAFAETRDVRRRANGAADRCSSSGLFSMAFNKCNVVKRLPLVVEKNGACYRFDRDIVWAGGEEDGPAIAWLGNRGELHACGHNFTLTNQTGQGILVHGGFAADDANPVAPGGGELTAYDLFMTRPDHGYSIDGYAVRAQFGATLTLEDAVFQDFFVSVMVEDAKLVARDINITASLSLDDPNRAAAWDDETWSFDAWGIRCVGSVDCSVEDYTFWASQDDASGDYRDVPVALSSIGFSCEYWNSDGSNSGAGFCRLERADITASQGVRAMAAHSILLRDVNVAVLPGAENLFNTTFWGSTEDPLNSPDGWHIGIQVQATNSSSAIVERVSVDARSLNRFATINTALQLSSGGGLVISEANVYGRAPAAEWYSEADFDPGYTLIQVGLVQIDTIATTDMAITPLRIERLNVRATDNTSYGVTIATARIFAGFAVLCDASNVTVALDHCTFVGGSVGVLVGSGSVDQVSITDSRFSGSYYGLYQTNGSRNTLTRECYHTRHCEAVHVDEFATNVIVDAARFSDNFWDVIDDHGFPGVRIEGLITTGAQNTTCVDVQPTLYNIDPATCVGGDSVEEESQHHASARRRAMYAHGYMT